MGPSTPYRPWTIALLEIEIEIDMSACCNDSKPVLLNIKQVPDTFCPSLSIPSCYQRSLLLFHPLALSAGVNTGGLCNPSPLHFQPQETLELLHPSNLQRYLDCQGFRPDSVNSLTEKHPHSKIGQPCFISPAYHPSSILVGH